ncbi:RagB/SusD family nutrient uptake outer membrane protein [Rufibacter sediminis]|uniref:RagB/SusD family nutrient uptake outer membrane protein n=1 Tax=Rufibacter sediminis TaxID=2762756 RepID=A0ABR6VRT4_9BACT|nr:RagB/SusD family nutrient uptake outer membrane protein [Rufibacter sediminis]MBC3539915.1 RagB/SusD family nutrient uptake outer membrane protein [Rufibacter sediminis]
MKSIKTIALAFGLLSLGACNDFLETEPITLQTESNSYSTPEDAFKALVGCYDGLQRVWADGISLPVAAEVLSDNSFGGAGNGDGFNYQAVDEFDPNRSPADRNLFEANWRAYYAAVYRCNVLLSKLEGIDWGTQANLKATYEAETRFLRAYLYFDMVRLWGNIPLLTEPSAENIAQANPDEVYKVIAQDLKFAAANLPNTTYAAQNPATYGRVTKWAAEALTARAFLYYTGYYGKSDLVGEVDKSQALAAVEDVIANGGFDLLDDFAKLWPVASVKNYAGEDNKETVFAVKYTFTSNYNGNTDGNHWMVMIGMREQASYPYGNGWGGATVNPKLWNAFSGDDTRKVASIISIADEKIDFQNKGKQREYTGYYIKKYSPMVDEEGNSLPVKQGGTNFMIGQFQDYVSIRYADVLLTAAELGSPNAQAYFDKVRRRAYKDKFTPLAVSQASIMNERRLEFAGEGIRYFDLLRQGINVAAAAIAETTTVENGGTAVSKTIAADKVVQTKGLQQIPYNQITLSGGTLKQNPGW